MTTTGRIDTHQHIVPPQYHDLLDRSWSNPCAVPTPAWSAARAIEVMGQNGIATAILSISVPGVHLGNDEDGRNWARTVNEFTADLVRENPASFGMFACLNLPDVDGSLTEAQYALDTLGADGVVLLANNDGTYLGDEAFELLLAELGRRGTTVFVHPNDLPTPPVPGVPPFAADFLLDTTRAALKLAMSGTLTRYPDLKIILSHGGGFLPYVIDRVAPMVGGGDPDAGRELLGKFWFDLALASGPAALPSLLAFADPTHLTYGSDFPYAPDQVIGRFRADYETAEIGSELRAAIDRGNAETLFPRLASA